uniref:Uncharacterized protein n=1 Tax=Romanomermis culicivorax TaxID=13658 RepID=A0A915JD77_ROMCU
MVNKKSILLIVRSYRCIILNRLPDNCIGTNKKPVRRTIPGSNAHPRSQNENGSKMAEDLGCQKS